MKTVYRWTPSGRKIDYAATHSTYNSSNQPFQVSSQDRRDMRNPETVGYAILANMEGGGETACKAADRLYRE